MGYRCLEMALIKRTDAYDKFSKNQILENLKRNNEVRVSVTKLSKEEAEFAKTCETGEKTEGFFNTVIKTSEYAATTLSMSIAAAAIAAAIANPATSPMALFAGGAVLSAEFLNIIQKFANDTGITNEILKSMVKDEKQRNTINKIMDIASSVFSFATIGISTLFNPFKGVFSSALKGTNTVGKVFSSIFLTFQTTMYGTKGVVSYNTNKLRAKITLLQGEKKVYQLNLKDLDNGLESTITFRKDFMDKTFYIFQKHLLTQKNRR